MDLALCLHDQRREALGPVNKWFCSQYHGYEINDPETLLAYYIRSGGAENYRRRLAEMGRQQPWSEAETQPPTYAI